MSATGPDVARRPARRWIDRALFTVLFTLGSALIRPLFRFRVIGRLRIPPSRRAILAPNHCSFLDPVALQAAIPRRVTFLMTEEIYRVPWARWFFRSMGTISMPEDRLQLSAMKEGIAAVERGELLVIFPEGRISRDGELKPGFPGIASIAARTGALVVPVHIDGTFRAFPKGARFIRLAQITVRFGEPIELPKGDDVDRNALRRATEAIMVAIRDLGVNA